MNAATVSHFREIGEERVDEFYAKGYKKRYFFPHRVYYLPKCGPDGFKLARRMCGRCDLNQLWEIVVYASRPLTDEFPRALFFDDDVIWHQQQFGKIGQVATANLVTTGKSLYSMVHISDLVQRISRWREHKTRIENRFKGWNHMLLNAVLNFARENNLTPIYTPTSELALQNTDPARDVARELFDRIYDANLHELFKASKSGGWWVIDIKENQDRIVSPEPKEEKISHEKTICLCHDIERGFGHTNVDPAFAKFAHATSGRNLDEMLAIEEEMDVKATFNVVGILLPEVRESIEAMGHCLAFHSYDHQIDQNGPLAKKLLKFINLYHRRKTGDPISLNQLDKCRMVDYRIKGYRPPQSKITPELSASKLAFHNFEWLASSAYSLGIKVPEMRNRIVNIPILFDDFEMYSCRMKYEAWEKRAIESIKQNHFVSFSMHDCYAHFWLPYYRMFLRKIKDLGKLKTLNEIADEVILSNAK